MRLKIFRGAFAVCLAVLLVCAALFWGALSHIYEEQLFTQLAAEAAYVAQGVQISGEEYFNALKTDDRVTWIDADGRVLYDSAADAASMENHLGREEISQAIERGTGRSVHFSDTLLKKTFYCAQRLTNGTVVRVSCTQGTAAALLMRLMKPIVWAVLVVAALSGFLASWLAGQIIRPLNSIDLDHPERNHTYQELAPLTDRLTEQNRTIRRQMQELERRQRDFTAITENMSEGFLLLDRKGNILSGNQSARRLLTEKAALVSKKTARRELADAAQEALAGVRGERRMEDGAHCLRVIATPVTENGQVTGAVLLVMDVTENERREQLRREFSANVSHELKTPLTSISGFAELMKEGLVSPDKIREFSGDIYAESQRLIALVEDILRLSKLDEDEPVFERETVDLYALAQETLRRLQSAADAKDVTMRLEGGKTPLTGARPVLEEILTSLCDNAVKYNRPGGTVTVTVKPREGTGAVLCVEDTGVGIPLEDQNRVFERFYRVDKSRSGAVEGTGLGLSIVRHGAEYHHARVQLESTPGEGTKVTVVF